MQKLRDWLWRGSENAFGLISLLSIITRAVANSSTSLETISQSVTPDGKSVPNSVARPIALLLICLLATINFFVMAQVSFTLFYLLIAAYAAWSGGKRTGLQVTAICLLALVALELKRSTLQPFDWAAGWNLAMQMSILVFVGLLVSALRSLTENLESRVKDRTTALEREILERKQTDEQLLKTSQQLRQLADNISDVFWIRNSGETRIVYVSPAYESIWGRSCRELYLSPDAWLETIHPEERDKVSDAVRTKQPLGEYSQEYRIVRPDGAQRWIRDRAFPIRDSSGKVIRIVGIAEDVTERHHFERQILEISDREQARLGQDLHDSLCQKLVSIAFDNNALIRRLATREIPEVANAEKLATVLDDAITEARTLARGLFPVQLETDGLSIALQQLATSVRDRFKVTCDAQVSQTVTVSNNAAATHLYRIAQEAVNNSVKHAKARTISIRLKTHGQFIELSVADDGVGITMPPDFKNGMGLHIMEYRARTIGGTLSIRRRPNGGTVVTCSTPQQTD